MTFATRTLGMIALAVLSASLTVGTTATAQTSPGTSIATDYQSPFWVGDRGMNANVLLEGPKAVARETAAEWRYRFSKIEFGQELGRIVANYRESDLYTKAQSDLSVARLNHDAARNRVLSRLMESPSFAANTHVHNQLGEQLATESARSKPDARKISAIASMRLQMIAANRKAEALAMENDSTYQSARLRLEHASAKLSQLEAELRKQVRNDSDLIAMRKMSRELRIEHLAADAYRESVRFLAQDAAAYSLALRDADRRRPQLVDRAYRDDYMSGFGYGSSGWSNDWSWAK
jgi:hypothetical protein